MHRVVTFCAWQCHGSRQRLPFVLPSLSHHRIHGQLYVSTTMGQTYVNMDGCGAHAPDNGFIVTHATSDAAVCECGIVLMQQQLKMLYLF